MANNFIFIVLDSCRFDSFAAAKTPNIDKLGESSKRYSYASWTLPSHHVYMMGASPHINPRGVFASEVYKKDFLIWEKRLGIKGASFRDFVPYFSLPSYLQSKGYKTNALVSMPVLNQLTLLNKYFDQYELMDEHDDFEGIIDKMKFGSEPSFYLLNVGETHYPYTVKGEEIEDKELLYGDKGVFVHQGDLIVPQSDNTPIEQYFHLDRLKELHQKQIRNVEHIDKLMAKLYDKVPKDTYIVVTADHGETFGEDGLFGHGPVMHEKVFEVFLVEGKIR